MKIKASRQPRDNPLDEPADYRKFLLQLPARMPTVAMRPDLADVDKVKIIRKYRPEVG